MNDPLDPKSVPRRRMGVKSSGGALMMIAVIGAFVAIGGFLLNLERDPVVRIPTHVVPSPNAFDDYARAGQVMTDVNIANGLPHSIIYARVMSPLAQDRLLKAHSPTFAEIRIGLKHPYLSPPVRSASHRFADLYVDYQLTSLLEIRADREEAREEWAASAQTRLDAIQMGENIPRGGGVDHFNSGLGIVNNSQVSLTRIVNNLNLVETRQALSRLYEIDAAAQPLDQTLEEQKWILQSVLLEIFQKPNWREQLVPARRRSRKDVRMKVAIFLTSKRQVMDSYTHYMDDWIAGVRAHRPALSFHGAGSDPFLQGLTSNSQDSEMLTRYDENRTRGAFLEIQLALHAYELQHHSYPESLVALTPDLPNIPSDPFAYGQTLRYHKTGKSYRLYSVGPDGVDDGGKEITTPTQTPGQWTLDVHPQSKGDVVASMYS
ncbi:MAG: hypothetical protein ABIY70_04455 [Capsulimonas sp.]|uniref:hypothetical protein n=1 Tax=Capsulimonas sp. TaxID=2494211 RepID=UPI0032631764